MYISVSISLLIFVILIVAYIWMYTSLNTLHQVYDYGLHSGARLCGTNYEGVCMSNYVVCSNNFDCLTKSIELQHMNNVNLIKVDHINKYQINSIHSLVALPIIVIIIVVFDLVCHVYSIALSAEW